MPMKMSKKTMLKLSLILGFVIVVIVFFLVYDVRIEKEISFEKYPPLLDAIETNASINEIKTILAEDPEEISRLQNQEGPLVSTDPICLAAMLNRKDIIFLLMEYGGDPVKAIKFIKNQYGEYGGVDAIALIEECTKDKATAKKKL